VLVGFSAYANNSRDGLPLAGSSQHLIKFDKTGGKIGGNSVTKTGGSEDNQVHVINGGVRTPGLENKGKDSYTLASDDVNLSYEWKFITEPYIGHTVNTTAICSLLFAQ
jgi:hypothetical protein